MKISEEKKIAGVEIVRNKLIETRRRLFKGFPKFREYYFKDSHKDTDAEFHKELTGLLMKMTNKEGSKIAIAAPRDSAKSTIVTLEFVIYCICYKLESYILIISNTRDQATGFLRDIKQELESNELLMHDFPEVCDRQIKPKPAPWKEGEIITPNKVKVTALGTDQEPRSRRNRKDRPSLIILDDIEPSAPIQNPDNFNKLENWITNSVLKSGTTTTNVVYVGTIHHYDSLLAKFTSENEYPGWEKRIFRSIISYSERLDLWEVWKKIFYRKEQYEGENGKDAAFKYFKANEEEMLKGTKVLWPARKSYYDLMVQREEEGAYSFDSEMQNEPINPLDCYFIQEDVHFWDDMYKTEEALWPFLQTHDIETLGSCDPSMGKEGVRGDPSAIITVVKDYTDDKIYILDADIVKRLPSKIYEDILMYHRRRNYSEFSFEVTQAQEAMAMQLQDYISNAGLLLNIQEYRTQVNKIVRIQELQQPVKNGKILFSRKHYNLLEEMWRFPRGRFDDGLDALRQVVELCMNSTGGHLGCPQAFQGNAGKSDVLGNDPDLRYTNFPQVHKERKDRFVPDPDDY
jgi:predicted phage terminase large subunit-like protein